MRQVAVVTNRPPRHGTAAAMQPPLVRSKVVGWAVALFLVMTAAITAVLVTLFEPVSGGLANDPVPRVTVTAVAGEQPVGEETGRITAQTLPGDQAVVDEPSILVGPGIDLSKHSIDDPASPWVVVNKTRPLVPRLWEPPELESVGSAQLVPEAASALGEMIAAIEGHDMVLNTGTGYRGFGLQEALYSGYVAEFGENSADRFSARPGYSEHQTGWAVDVFASEQCRLQECFGSEPEGVWLAEHAHEYGFITRYPQGQEDVTGYRYEPWHLRYVGTELALAMREADILTLELAFGLPRAPDYN